MLFKKKHTILNREKKTPKRIDRFVGIPLIFFWSLLRPLHNLIFTSSKSSGKILCLKISALGDMVVMAPALELLRKTYPQSEIHFLGGPSTLGMAKALPWITQIHSLNFKSLLRLRKTSFDLVIDFDQWARLTALIATSMKSKNVVGFKSSRQFRHFAYDQNIKLDFKKHIGLNFWNLALMGMSRLNPNQTQTQSWKESIENAQKQIQAIHKKSGTQDFIVFHPGCGAHGMPRTWPVENWQKLIQYFSDKFPSTQVLLTGAGKEELALIDKLKASNTKVSTDLSISEVLSLLSQAKLVVVGNTGAMHMANLMNPNVIALHGPTSQELWGPLWKSITISSTLACSPCLTWGHDYGCSDVVCMKSIQPKRVIEAITQIYA